MTSPTSIGSEFAAHLAEHAAKAKFIIETGTFNGQGSTAAIARAMQPGCRFISIEADENHAMAAQKFAWANKFRVEIALGLSLPRSMLPSVQDIADVLRHVDQSIAVDYPDVSIAERAERYYVESLSAGSDDLLGRALAEGRPDLVLLDSAGHLGFLEFQYLLSKFPREIIRSDNSCRGQVVRCIPDISRNASDGSFIIALDDTRHIKHFRSLAVMKPHAQFKILAEGSERFGWAIGLFTP